MNLAEICMSSIRNSPKFKTLEGLLLIYSKLDSGNPVYADIRGYAIKNLCERYPMLYDKYGVEEMKLIFSPEDFERFEQERLNSLEIKNRFAYLKGSIIEPVVKDVKPTEDGCYPIEALVQGAAWPADVDPTKRETYLSESDFAAVFKMSRAEYLSKDKFVRLRLKKEHKLF